MTCSNENAEFPVKRQVTDVDWRGTENEAIRLFVRGELSGTEAVSSSTLHGLPSSFPRCPRRRRIEGGGDALHNAFPFFRLVHSRV